MDVERQLLLAQRQRAVVSRNYKQVINRWLLGSTLRR
jgi:hypothetical protein